MVLAATAIVFVVGCGSKDAEPLATVGDVEVTDEQFAAYLRFRHIDSSDPARTAQHLDEYLKRKALAEAIEATDGLDRAAMAAELDDLRTEMLISRYFEHHLEEAVTDETVRNYYNTHVADYEERKIHVAHILIRTGRDMPDAERQAALTRAQEAYSMLRAGRDFGEIAQASSEDRVSASRGGDLGFIREGAIDPEFSRRAFATAVGTFTEPFATSFGYHIIKVIEAAQTVRRPLSSVEGDIRYALRNRTKEAEVTRLRATIETDIRSGGFRAPPASERAATPARPRTRPSPQVPAHVRPREAPAASPPSAHAEPSSDDSDAGVAP